MTKKAAPITVLLPVIHPNQDYFPLTIQSVLDQSFQDFELLVVESASTSLSSALLKRFDDPRIRHVVTAPCDRVSLLNKGLAMATGALIARIDQSDIALPDRLMLQIAMLDQDPSISMLGSFVEWIDEENRPLGFQSFPIESDAIHGAIASRCSLDEATATYWRRAIQSEGGYKGRPEVSGYHLLARLSRSNPTLCNLPAALTRRRWRANQWSGIAAREHLQQMIATKVELLSERMDAKAKLKLLLEKVSLKLPLDMLVNRTVRPRLRSKLPVE